MHRDLTERQRAVWDFVAGHRETHGWPPSVREIQRHFGFASPNAVNGHLRALGKKGLLARDGRKARGLVAGTPARSATRPGEVPLLGAIPAGWPSGSEERREACVHVDLEALGLPRGARVFALKVRGDSMTGAHILDGDIVILELKPPAHGKVVAALIDGESTLKTYVVRNGQPFLRAENPAFPDLVPARELVIQGVMVGLLRTG